MPNDLLAMPPRNADLETSWTFLKEGMDKILSRHLAALPYFEYMSLYTVVYNYCTSGKARRGMRQQDNSGGNMMGSGLYTKLKAYLKQHVNGVNGDINHLAEEELLRYYTKEWDRYTKASKLIDGMFNFLNRHWVNRERQEGRKNVYTVFVLALIQWKSCLFESIQGADHKLTNAALRLVENKRNGEDVDEPVKTVVESFLMLDIDGQNLDERSLALYEKAFETPFIESTEKYYTIESRHCLAENSVSDYLRKAERRLKEEEDRADRYLNATTRAPLLRTVAEAFAGAHDTFVPEELQRLLEVDDIEDLRKLYALLSRIPEKLGTLHSSFELHTKKVGLETIRQLVYGADSSMAKGVVPTEYVNALLKFHRKKLEMINYSFQGDSDFNLGLGKVCHELINRNIVTETTTSEVLLADYVDELLRKDNKMSEEESLEDALNQVMIIFEYIEDKDAFQALYAVKLSKRVAHGISVSDEAEASMILKLKETCGFEYTNNLQHMRLSNDITAQFRERMAVLYPDDNNCTSAITILSKALWPLSIPSNNYKIPMDILPVYDRFSHYYQEQHGGRELTWLWNYSKNEIQTNYTARKYTLITNSYQMAVLSQFDDYDILTLKDFVEHTGLTQGIVQQTLTHLVKAKILLETKDDVSYVLNFGFKLKKIKLNLHSTKAEDKSEASESSDALKLVQEDRKYTIQARIIRIMKARKQMESERLVEEVISQLSHRFLPKLSDIKIAIDVLLENGYIERVDGMKCTVSYVA